ncbi:hypothetical protein DFJ74DRAFT_684979 [Hyaloraphidium curvatum]|nr:hypothetical protein DFJ74DRAFT_684979 [Hyaloraphidium curvatum]
MADVQESDFSLASDLCANKRAYYALLGAANAADLGFGCDAASGLAWIHASWLLGFYNQCVAPMRAPAGCTAADAAGALDTMERDLARFGRPALLMLPSSSTAAGGPWDGCDPVLRAALVKKGFLLVRGADGGVFSMAADLASLDEADLRRRIADTEARLDVEILELARPGAAGDGQPTPEAVMATMVRGFGFPKSTAPYFARTLGSAPCGPQGPLRNYVVLRKGDRASPLGFVSIFVEGGTAGMYNLAVPKESRGGLGGLLTLRCLLDAKASGYKHLLLQPSPKAVALYKKNGFRVTSGGGEVWLYGSWRMGWFPFALFWAVRVGFAVWGVVKGPVGLIRRTVAWVGRFFGLGSSEGNAKGA